MPLDAKAHLSQPDIDRQYAIVTKAEHDGEDIEAGLQDAFAIQKDVDEREQGDQNGRDE